MNTPTPTPSPIMTAHSYFMKAEGEVDANNVSGALDYYKKAFDIFNVELQQSPLLPFYQDFSSPPQLDPYLKTIHKFFRDAVNYNRSHILQQEKPHPS